MQLQTHLMCGWCLGNGFTLTARERFHCMLASIAPDIDGIGRIYSEDAFFTWHHVAAHNLVFAALISGTLAAFSTHRIKALILYFVFVHLHLLMDFLGSGPGWGIVYFWPFSKWSAINPYAWPFFSWENLSLAAVFFLWVLAIAIWDGRTPLEAIMPSLDRQLVDTLRRFCSLPTKDNEPDRSDP